MGLATTARRLGWTGICAGAAIVLAASPVAADTAAVTGPSSSASPYLVPVAPGVTTTSLLTVGDSVGGYRLVGIPDGLGVLGGDDGTFRLFVNHELGASAGVVRAHGATGAFVSEWSIDAASLAVRSGRDLIDEVTVSTGGPALARLCSANLAAKPAFWDPASKTGYNGRIFMDGEESGPEGRAFAHLVTGSQQGESFELPALGNASWENLVASPASGRKTVVVGTDDATPGQVYVYVGEKQRTGTPIERAGLAQGSLYGVKVPGVPLEDRSAGVGGTSVAFGLASLGDVSGKTGAQIQSASTAAGITEFLRPEDGAWDPTNPGDFYFVTTDRFDTVQTPSTDGVANTPAGQVGNSRLWRLRFADVTDPAAGGTLQLLLDGTEGPQMMDNLTVDQTGHVLIQEDPGNQAYIARVWSYDIAADTVTAIAKHDPARFGVGGASFLTKDEESSGIVDASEVLGPGWFLLDVQAHYELGGELVEGGQLLALYSPASDPTR